jgi:membrane protein
MIKFKTIWSLLTDTYNQLLDDKGFKMAAALSYYAAFSLGPLLIIIISIAGFFFSEEAATGQIIKQMDDLMGRDGAELVQTIIKGAADTSTGIFATIVSVILLILGSVGVFIELHESLNIIWGVELKPGRGIWGFIKNRLVSFSMVVASGFVLLISLIVNSVITLLNEYFSNVFGLALPLAQVLNMLSAFVIITVVFALMFKYLPDVVIEWKYVWLGAGITSLLFSIGKYLIGLYLGNTSFSSTYGASASLAVLFIWIYYSGVILFLGAEFTQVYRSRYGKCPLKEGVDGVIIPKVSELIKKSVEKEEKKKEAKSDKH